MRSIREVVGRVGVLLGLSLVAFVPTEASSLSQAQACNQQCELAEQECEDTGGSGMIGMCSYNYSNNTCTTKLCVYEGMPPP